MTICEYIVNAELNIAESRLNKLHEIGAPEVIFKSLGDYINNLKNGDIEISGDSDLLNVNYVSSEIKTGNGGKKYICFNNSINYFPKAKYGKYITKKTEA